MIGQYASMAETTSILDLPQEILFNASSTSIHPVDLYLLSLTCKAFANVRGNIPSAMALMHRAEETGSVRAYEVALRRGCECDEGINAARHGHLELMLWIHRASAPSYALVKAALAAAVGAAAEAGHIHILKWYLDTMKPSYYLTEQIYPSAMRNGQVSLLEWAYEYDKQPDSYTTVTLIFALAYIGTVEQLVRVGLGPRRPGEYTVCCGAAEGGNLDILKWMVGSGVTIDEHLFGRAAEHGRKNVIDWAEACGLVSGGI